MTIPTLPARFLSLVLLSTLALAAPAPETSRPGEAAIASAHPLASAAGHEILSAGGNAFDAAVAVSAALAVVEPYSTGIGGGGFWLLHRQEDGFKVLVDGREKAPMAAHRDMYLDENGDPRPNASRDGPLAAGIPGLPAGIEHLSKTYGRLSFARCLEPAIRYARDGFQSDQRLISGLRFKRDLLRRWPMAARVFLDENGDVPPEGTLVRQPELAETLEQMAGRGAASFYRGRRARAMVNAVRDAGGIWSTADLEAYTVVEREPLTGEYRGMRVISAPPPSSGGVVLIDALNILAAWDLQTLEPAVRTHLIVESMRRAYRDRAEYLGDPDFVDMPVERLVHPFYAAGQRAGIRLARATPSISLPGVVPEGPKGMDTTHFSVLDADGNRVAGTMSLNFWFGSGYMAPNGVLLNNQMDDFSVKPGVPNGYELVGAEANAIAPGKRMLSSMTPTFVESDRGVAILGTPGGSRIISMVLLGILSWDSGADAKTIVSRPRFHHQYLPDEIVHEAGAFDDEQRRLLESWGHTLKESSRQYGNLQAVTWNYETGKVEAASDPRGVGEALVY